MLWLKRYCQKKTSTKMNMLSKIIQQISMLANMEIILQKYKIIPFRIILCIRNTNIRDNFHIDVKYYCFPLIINQEMLD